LSSGLPTRILQVLYAISHARTTLFLPPPFFLLHLDSSSPVFSRVLHTTDMCPLLHFTNIMAGCLFMVCFVLQNSSSLTWLWMHNFRFYCLCITCLFSVEYRLDTSSSWVYLYFSLILVLCAAIFILSVHALFPKTNSYLKLIQKFHSQIALC